MARGFNQGSYNAGETGRLVNPALDALASKQEGETTKDRIAKMSIADIANAVERDWASKGKGVNFGAKPYLEAMFSLNSIDENYGLDAGRDIVNYFLANATGWKGDFAKAVKAELKARVSNKYSANEPPSRWSEKQIVDKLVDTAKQLFSRADDLRTQLRSGQFSESEKASVERQIKTNEAQSMAIDITKNLTNIRVQGLTAKELPVRQPWQQWGLYRQKEQNERTLEGNANALKSIKSAIASGRDEQGGIIETRYINTLKSLAKEIENSSKYIKENGDKVIEDAQVVAGLYSIYRDQIADRNSAGKNVYREMADVANKFVDLDKQAKGVNESIDKFESVGLAVRWTGGALEKARNIINPLGANYEGPQDDSFGGRY